MKGCVSKKLVWLCVAVVLTWAVASTAGAQVMKPLADGFPKRAITLINIDDPGTRDGIYARMMQTACKGISPVPVLVSDEPIAQGGTWMKANELKKRPGALEGYYPFVFTAFGVVTDLQVEPLTRDINAKLSDVKMVIVTDQLPYVVIQKKNAPWGRKFEDLMKYIKAHPGELKYVSYEVGSGHDIMFEWLLARYGVGGKVKKIPQSTMQECASAIGAGEADVSAIGVDVAYTNWQAGRIDMSLLMSEKKPAPWDKDDGATAAGEIKIPTFCSTIMSWAVNGEVPDSHVDWLYQLFTAAAKTPGFAKRWQGMIPGDIERHMTGAAAAKMNQEIFDAMDQPLKDIGLHIDVIKRK